MFTSCLCLRHGAYLNGTSNVFAYLLIIYLGRHRFEFLDALASFHNDILAHLVLIKNLTSLYFSRGIK